MGVHMSHNPYNPENKKPTGGNRRASLVVKQPYTKGNSASAQRKRLLEALRIKPMSTIEIRRKLDILGVAPRILELRRKGNSILTQWHVEPTECGRLHRVALYVLVKEARV